MAYTQAQLDELDARIATLVKRTQFADGRMVENFDLDQLRRQRNEMKAELAASASQVSRRTRFIVGRVGRR